MEDLDHFLQVKFSYFESKFIDYGYGPGKPCGFIKLIIT